MSIVVLGQMIKLFAVLLCLFAFPVLAQSTCLQTAREVAPQISDETRRDFESRLAQARENLAKNSNDVENLIWLGRRTAYVGQYKEAIRIYTQAIKSFPNDARLYRHIILTVPAMFRTPFYQNAAAVLSAFMRCGAQCLDDFYS